MKHTRLTAHAGTLTFIGAMCVALASSPASSGAQTPSQPPPPTKQPRLPTTRPTDPTPATPSAGKSREGTPEATAAAADVEFVTEAAAGGLLEVELGRIAVQKASHDRVKQFGQRMMDDHSKVNEALRTIAGAKQITLPDEARAKVKHKSTIARLERLSGPAFDKAYIADMVKDHVTDVAAFEREASSGKDPEVQAFARKALPTLRDHLTQVREIARTLAMKGTH